MMTLTESDKLVTPILQSRVFKNHKILQEKVAEGRKLFEGFKLTNPLQINQCEILDKEKERFFREFIAMYEEILTNRVLTEVMISKSPAFVNKLSETIFNQLTKESKKKATAIVGILPFVHMHISFEMARRLNGFRKWNFKQFFWEFWKKPSCRGIYTKYNTKSRIVIRKQTPTRLRDKIVVAGFLFDSPEKHLEDIPWKHTPKAHRDYEMSLLLQDQEWINEFIEKETFGELIQTIILPIPYDDYDEFMVNIEK